MSHLKNPPAANSVRSPLALQCMSLIAFADRVPLATRAVLSVALALNCGCAMIHIPSYRLEECAAENYSSTPALLPPVPMPGWLARWKAEKHLPKPPESPRFHPVPTRPMFQPPVSNQFSGEASEDVCFGKLPSPETWNAPESIEAVPAVPMPTLATPQ